MTTTAIIETVANVTGIPARVILGKRRTDIVCHARFMAVEAISAAMPWMSLQNVAEAVGKRQHGMTNHAQCRHREWMVARPEYAATFREVQTAVKAQPK